MTSNHLGLISELSKIIYLDEQSIAELNKDLLNVLLKDNTSNKNILWATNNYVKLGDAYLPDKEIMPELIIGRNTKIIQPRSQKNIAEQIKRTFDKAEVFTPSWMCNMQNNILDIAWFGRTDVFNIHEGKGWSSTKQKIEFPRNKSWIDYVAENRLEITCGEAPYIVSRYDSVTGEYLPIYSRVGLLDRKLRVVSENCLDKDEWIKYSLLAMKSVFGYEWQGDNLLLARENVLLTYLDYYEDSFKELPTQELLIEVASIISWNFWQMDGIKYVIPNSCKNIIVSNINLFGETNIEEVECEGCAKAIISKHNGMYSKIKDWQKNEVITFASITTMGD